MKDRFIRVISPISFCVITVLDIAIIAFGVFAYQKITADKNIYNIMFVGIEVVAFIIGILASKEVVSNGVKFEYTKMEFTGLDENNIFEYKNIERIETNKDTKASLRKNFVDRYSSIIIHQTDGTVTTIELGLTTLKTLTKIEEEINKRI